jgi:predicted GNAT family N-acyltransferase
MPSVANTKTSRLDARITPELREQLRYVAARQGRSISDYVSTALHQAVHILLPELPEALTAKLPRYPAVPAALIGRLAIATTFRGRKLGSVLLSGAVARAATADLATFAMVTDPKDATARRFYEHHGFTALRSTGG